MAVFSSSCLTTVLLVSSCTAFAPLSSSVRRGGALSAEQHDVSSPDFTVGVVGDLHIDPRTMEDYYTGRDHWLNVFAKESETSTPQNKAIVSLGDLGESKSVRPDETNELFAGTTECHEMAAEFLNSFDGIPYEVVGGNHDLEGIDEFDTDAANLEMFLRVHKKPTPQFMRQIADKTLLVGLTSTVFRDAKYTSHEVTIDPAQLQWFEDVVKSHPAEEGWKLFVFTHAPPNGSGLRVLQENHVVNGCCWLNHSNEAECRKYIELCREHRCIKAWFSGHFHLGQDYQDSITFPTIDPKDGPYPNRGSCVFVQTSVMRKGTSRDTRQQSRLVRGYKDGFQICTVDHQKNGEVRVDATISYLGNENEVGVYANTENDKQDAAYFKVYQPSAGDALHPPDSGLVDYEDAMIMDKAITKDTIAWWYLKCGRVLGMLNGMLIEYDRSTLAPLGLVVGADELLGKRIAIVSSDDPEECLIVSDGDEMGMEGADCAIVEPDVEQAVLLMDDTTGSVTVVQPNEDGSYWRKIVRNKMIRMKEKRREQAAQTVAKTLLGSTDNADVVSSWGPYTSTVGTAKRTGVSGLTTAAEK